MPAICQGTAALFSRFSSDRIVLAIFTMVNGKKATTIAVNYINKSVTKTEFLMSLLIIVRNIMQNNDFLLYLLLTFSPKPSYDRASGVALAVLALFKMVKIGGIGRNSLILRHDFAGTLPAADRRWLGTR